MAVSDDSSALHWRGGGARKMGCRANISDAGAEGRTAGGAQFYGRSPMTNWSYELQIMKHNAEVFYNTTTADGDRHLFTGLSSFSSMTVMRRTADHKGAPPNGAITKCPIPPPANASSAGDISSYTKIHYYSSSPTIPSRPMYCLQAKKQKRFEGMCVFRHCWSQD